MSESIAKEYSSLLKSQCLPEPIKIDDQEFQESLYSYFNKNNLSKIVGGRGVFKPVIDSKIMVSQSDPLNLKVDVILTNKTRDWYIPRFEEKTYYSQNKIVLIGEGGKFSASYPNWWPVQPRGDNDPFVLRPQPPEHIGMFAKFNKGDQYHIEYVIRIPHNNHEIEFDLKFQDISMPPELLMKYRYANNAQFPEIYTISNTIKVKCKKKGKDESDGYICEFSR